MPVCFLRATSPSSNDTLDSGGVDVALRALPHLPLSYHYIEVLTWMRNEGFSRGNMCHSPAILLLKFYVPDASPLPNPTLLNT